MSIIEIVILGYSLLRCSLYVHKGFWQMYTGLKSWKYGKFIRWHNQPMQSRSIRGEEEGSKATKATLFGWRITDKSGQRPEHSHTSPGKHRSSVRSFISSHSRHANVYPGPILKRKCVYVFLCSLLSRSNYVYHSDFLLNDNCRSMHNSVSKVNKYMLKCIDIVRNNSLQHKRL